MELVPVILVPVLGGKATMYIKLYKKRNFPRPRLNKFDELELFMDHEDKKFIQNNMWEQAYRGSCAKVINSELIAMKFTSSKRCKKAIVVHNKALKKKQTRVKLEAMLLRKNVPKLGRYRSVDVSIL